MQDTELCFTPAHELAAMIRGRQVSPVTVMRAVLDRVSELEPALNAFTYVIADKAMEKARKAEAAVARGGDLPPLHGIPVTIKDLAPTADLPTEHGSFIYKGSPPAAEDAVHVRRLKEAGAIVIGKTTTSEVGWSPVSRSPLTGVTHNPWKRGYNAGASSSGAAVAAAAGFGPLHQGTDGAGSIRVPAHFCGIYGIKPTFGRVPYFPQPNIDYCSHIGPMTRTVRDSALMLEVMAGPDGSDHMCLEADPPRYSELLKADLKGKRIAFSPDLGIARVDPDVAALVRQAVETFAREAGVDIEEVETPWAASGPELIRFFWRAHFSEFGTYLEEWRDVMDPGLVAVIEAGRGITVAEYQSQRERKLAMCSQIGSWFKQWDLLLTPSVSVAAFPVELLQPPHWPQHEWDFASWVEFSYPFNFSHNPAASVPCGFTADGLPVGLQIVGRRFDDLGVLQASAAFEAILPWADKRPTIERAA